MKQFPILKIIKINLTSTIKITIILLLILSIDNLNRIIYLYMLYTFY